MPRKKELYILKKYMHKKTQPKLGFFIKGNYIVSFNPTDIILPLGS
jgi:hypothetical protein